MNGSQHVFDESFNSARAKISHARHKNMWMTVTMPKCKLTVSGSAAFFDLIYRRRGIITTRIIATYVAVIAVKGISQVSGG